MAKERKKVELKPAAKPVVPKKREKLETEIEDKPVIKPQTVEEPKPTEEEIVKEKRKKTDFKTVRIALNADIEQRKQFVDRMVKGELTMAYFAIDGDVGYHYYYVNKIN